MLTSSLVVDVQCLYVSTLHILPFRLSYDVRTMRDRFTVSESSEIAGLQHDPAITSQTSRRF